MFRKGITGIENHFLTAAWTFRNGSLHPYASTDYLRFLRDGLSGPFLDLVCAHHIPQQIQKDMDLVVS
jgi:hypothetical protein